MLNEDLARYENIYIRVSLKGANEEEFSALTGAEPRGFQYQLQALENLYRAGNIKFSLSNKYSKNDPVLRDGIDFWIATYSFTLIKLNS